MSLSDCTNTSYVVPTASQAACLFASSPNNNANSYLVLAAGCPKGQRVAESSCLAGNYGMTLAGSGIAYNKVAKIHAGACVYAFNPAYLNGPLPTSPRFNATAAKITWQVCDRRGRRKDRRAAAAARGGSGGGGGATCAAPIPFPPLTKPLTPSRPQKINAVRPDRRRRRHGRRRPGRAAHAHDRPGDRRVGHAVLQLWHQLLESAFAGRGAQPVPVGVGEVGAGHSALAITTAFFCLFITSRRHADAPPPLLLWCRSHARTHAHNHVEPTRIYFELCAQAHKTNKHVFAGDTGNGRKGANEELRRRGCARRQWRNIARRVMKHPRSTPQKINIVIT